jgi:hypothetical protein
MKAVWRTEARKKAGLVALAERERRSCSPASGHPRVPASVLGQLSDLAALSVRGEPTFIVFPLATRPRLPRRK